MTQTKEEQLKALGKIDRATLIALRSSGSPAMGPALIGAIAGGITGYGLTYVVQASWLLAAGVFIGGYVGFRIAKYKSWGEYIYVLLAAYHPEDKIAYAALQKQASERSLDFGDVRAWAKAEKERLAPSSPSRADQARDAFVAKPLR